MNFDTKTDLTLKGYLFVLLNVVATSTENATMGLVFGGCALYYFIKAIRIRNE